MNNRNKKKITVVGAGYVGLSISLMLARHNMVNILDIDLSKIKKINSKSSPIKDSMMEDFLINQELDLYATTNAKKAYSDSDFVVIATPTDYDPKKNYFNTSSVESVIKDVIKFNPQATIIIKSTVPVGFTQRLKNTHNHKNIIFSPEFLREGTALYDNLNPSRIIMGDESIQSKEFARLLVKSSNLEDEIPILYTNSSEAESIKLFSNTFLAMRVSFFNELDTYCETNNLDPKKVIEGMGLDKRIGNLYNNPSFGYGGYCLPKDSKQLLANYKDIPNKIITAIVESNDIRKKYIATTIAKKNPGIVGIYRLIMKEGSDNFRESAILDIIKYLTDAEIKVIIYEPLISDNYFLNCKVVNEFEVFSATSEIILANRLSNNLLNLRNKVYTRDLL